jgi:hypothetical protein
MRAGRKRQEHHRRADRGRGAGAGLCGAPRRLGITAGSDEGRAAPPRGGGGILAYGASRPFYANREKALFSHIFNKAREWGFTTARNPCRGVKGFKETGPSHYVTDEDFDRVRANAHCTVVDAMDIALLTGQWPRRAISTFLIQDENGSRSARVRCAHALTKRARWRKWIFSSGTFGRRLLPTRATSHIRRSC